MGSGVTSDRIESPAKVRTSRSAIAQGNPAAGHGRNYANRVNYRVSPPNCGFFNMARKTVSRMEKRLEAEAAEATEEAPKKKKKKAKRKKKAAADVRMKLFWGVFSPSMKRVALFDFNQKKQAQKRCDELTAKGKGDHFIQKVKDKVEEA